MLLKDRPTRYAYYDHDRKRGRMIEYLPSRRKSLKARLSQWIWLAAAAFTSLIALRFVMRFFAIDETNPFAALIYDLTHIFVEPFMSLTVTPAIEGDMAIELPVLLAIATYMLTAWLAVRLVTLMTGGDPEAQIKVKVSEWRD